MERMTLRVSLRGFLALLFFAIQPSHEATINEGIAKCKDFKLPANAVAVKSSHNNVLEITCQPGYRLIGSKRHICTGNGKWDSQPTKCQDINECATKEKSSPCNSNAECINTVGSYYCVCLPGFYGDGAKCKSHQRNLFRYKADKCGIVLLKNKTGGYRRRVRRVIGGQVSFAGKWPWQASVEINPRGPIQVAGAARLPFIGGALVKPGWVVTVASQLYIGTKLVLPKEVKVVLGKFDRSKPEHHEQRFEVQRVFVHPKFDREKVTYDIALLKLKTVEKRTPFVNAICLVGGKKARILEDPKHLPTVTGWGTTTQVDIGEDPGLFSRHLKEATIPLKNMRTCKKATAYGFNPRIMLCAGYLSGNASPCFGDHGAPLVIQNPYTGRWVLIGLYSWSEGCGKKEKFSYYTRVSRFRKWITGIVRQES